MSTPTTTTTHEVTLAIYDLSHGMARTLSAQFLGPNHTLDAIPHTALLVYGNEYYFGGGSGIDITSPHEFRQSRNIQPMQLLSLGPTTVSQLEFEEWCRVQRRGVYAAHRYDLFHRNCNHFCQEAAVKGLKLTRGPPEWVLQVPERVLSSPMGQLIRPMLEEMQVMGPTGAAGSSRLEEQRLSNSSSSSSSSSSSETNGSSTDALLQSNPWANMGTSSTVDSTTSSKESNESAPVASVNSTSETAVAPSVESKTVAKPSSPSKRPLSIPTPILSSYTHPLLSSDTKMLSMCFTKLKAANPDASPTLESLQKVLVPNAKTNSSPTTQTLLQQGCNALISLLEDSKTTPSHQVFALMVLRILVLHPVLDLTTSQSIMEWIQTPIEQDMDKSISYRAMAWCTLSNAVGAVQNHTYSVEELLGGNLASLVDAAIREGGLEEEAQGPIRQSIGSFLYNLVLNWDWVKQSEKKGSEQKEDEKKEGSEDGEEGLPDAIVAMLCGILENLSMEKDHETSLRKLLVLGKILTKVPLSKKKEHDDIRNGGFVNGLAWTLIKDLGYREEIAQVREGSEKGLGLTVELLAILDKC